MGTGDGVSVGIGVTVGSAVGVGARVGDWMGTGVGKGVAVGSVVGVGIAVPGGLAVAVGIGEGSGSVADVHAINAATANAMHAQVTKRRDVRFMSMVVLRPIAGVPMVISSHSRKRRSSCFLASYRGSLGRCPTRRGRGNWVVDCDRVAQ